MLASIHHVVALMIDPIYLLIDWLCWGLTTRQSLWVIVCPLPKKGRKEIEEIVEEMKEEQGRKRNRNEREETEEIPPPPHLPLPATKIVGLAQLHVNQYQLDAPVT